MEGTKGAREGTKESSPLMKSVRIVVCIMPHIFKNPCLPSIPSLYLHLLTPSEY